VQVVDKLDKDTQVLLLDMHEKTEPFTDMLKVFSPDHPLVLGKEVPPAPSPLPGKDH